MGTDDLGRDIFTRLLNGGRMSMTIGAVAVIISTIIGIIIDPYLDSLRKARLSIAKNFRGNKFFTILTICDDTVINNRKFYGL